MSESNSVKLNDQPPVEEKIEPISPAVTEASATDDAAPKEPVAGPAPQEVCEGASQPSEPEPDRAATSETAVAQTEDLEQPQTTEQAQDPTEPAKEVQQDPIGETVVASAANEDPAVDTTQAVAEVEAAGAVAEVEAPENIESGEAPQAVDSIYVTTGDADPNASQEVLLAAVPDDAENLEPIPTPQCPPAEEPEQKTEVPAPILSSSKVEGAVSDGESKEIDGGADDDGHLTQPTVLQHSVSAMTKTKESGKKLRRRKRKPTEFVKPAAPSQADASIFKEAATPERPAVFEAQPRAVKAADVSYKASVDELPKASSPSMFEKPAAPSCADTSFSAELTSSQKKAVFSSHASPSMADVNYASPTPTKSTTSLFVSPPKQSTADTGANAAGLTSGFGNQKSVYESEARPSLAAVRASDPVPQTRAGPALFTKPPAETKAHARAGVELTKQNSQTASVFESAPKPVPVAAKWCDPVKPKNSASVFESKAAPSRADAAADRSLDSDDEYETDTDEE